MDLFLMLVVVCIGVLGFILMCFLKKLQTVDTRQQHIERELHAIQSQVAHGILIDNQAMMIPPEHLFAQRPSPQRAPPQHAAQHAQQAQQVASKEPVQDQSAQSQRACCSRANAQRKQEAPVVNDATEDEESSAYEESSSDTEWHDPISNLLQHLAPPMVRMPNGMDMAADMMPDVGVSIIMTEVAQEPQSTTIEDVTNQYASNETRADVQQETPAEAGDKKPKQRIVVKLRGDA